MLNSRELINSLTEIKKQAILIEKESAKRNEQSVNVFLATTKALFEQIGTRLYATESNNTAKGQVEDIWQMLAPQHQLERKNLHLYHKPIALMISNGFYLDIKFKNDKTILFILFGIYGSNIMMPTLNNLKLQNILINTLQQEYNGRDIFQHVEHMTNSLVKEIINSKVVHDATLKNYLSFGKKLKRFLQVNAIENQASAEFVNYFSRSYDKILQENVLAKRVPSPNVTGDSTHTITQRSKKARKRFDYTSEPEHKRMLFMYETASQNTSVSQGDISAFANTMFDDNWDFMQVCSTIEYLDSARKLKM